MPDIQVVYFSDAQGHEGVRGLVRPGRIPSKDRPGVSGYFNWAMSVFLMSSMEPSPSSSMYLNPAVSARFLK